MKLDNTSKSIIFFSVVSAIIVIALLVTFAPKAKAGELPLWKQERTLAAAAPFCAANRGVYEIRPNAQGNYWLTCQDSTMIRVKIKVSKNHLVVIAKKLLGV